MKLCISRSGVPVTELISVDNGVDSVVDDKAAAATDGGGGGPGG